MNPSPPPNSVDNRMGPFMVEVAWDYQSKKIFPNILFFIKFSFFLLSNRTTWNILVTKVLKENSSTTIPALVWLLILSPVGIVHSWMGNPLEIVWYIFFSIIKAISPQSNFIEISMPFSSPEAAILLVSTKNRDLWQAQTLEVRDLETHYIKSGKSDWLKIQNEYSAVTLKKLAPARCLNFSILVLTKRIMVSGDKNEKFSRHIFLLFSMPNLWKQSLWN